ncbi:MAG: histone deacetylase [Reinekea sp.]|nr:histone deacetylase [Reinekea sp.]
MKLPLIYHRDYSPAFDPAHRFPMEKFHLLHQHLYDIGLTKQCELFTPTLINDSLLELAHDKDYIERFKTNLLTNKEIRRIGLPWSEALVRRTRLAVGGSVLSMELALERGLSAHLAGGTHHAHRDFGSGFCIFNDLAVCALHALRRDDVERVMIIDLDVHQGDGTANILANEPNAITVSFHCKQNFPARKASSDYDIEIDRHTGDEHYLQLLKSHIPYLLELHQPDLVLYDAGSDPYEHDALGLLNISAEGLEKRDYFVLTECVQRRIPVSCVIGGGYMKDRQHLARIHSIVHQTAAKVWQECFA